jgi:hypothetical protein
MTSCPSTDYDCPLGLCRTYRDYVCGPVAGSLVAIAASVAFTLDAAAIRTPLMTRKKTAPAQAYVLSAMVHIGRQKFIIEPVLIKEDLPMHM